MLYGEIQDFQKYYVDCIEKGGGGVFEDIILYKDAGIKCSIE